MRANLRDSMAVDRSLDGDNEAHIALPWQEVAMILSYTSCKAMGRWQIPPIECRRRRDDLWTEEGAVTSKIRRRLRPRANAGSRVVWRKPNDWGEATSPGLLTRA